MTDQVDVLPRELFANHLTEDFGADLFAGWLVAGTQGGLDGRFLISHLKPTNFRVRSISRDWGSQAARTIE
jgi:hypothetical protein